MTPFELDLVTFLDQQYQLTGELLSADKAHDEFGIPKKAYNDALGKQDVKDALSERGIIFERYNDDFTQHSLTPTQLLLANSILDLTDTRTNKRKCQDLGISTLQYNAWMKDEVFKSYIHTRAEQMLGDSQHEAAMALMDKVRAGDVKAISFWYELTGRYTPQRAGGGVDVSQLIVRIIEIIDEEVNDPDTLRRLGLRLRSLVATRNTANALLGVDDDAIVVPQIAKARPLLVEASSDTESL